ncbi:hypothetical protein [Hymenobacter koreensis]|uniref:Uncharacterized protein n=1 Tax=Hymenobacter koreensis TaxID=1084523 RepID=A0ABP8IT76_9BACT
MKQTTPQISWTTLVLWIMIVETITATSVILIYQEAGLIAVVAIIIKVLTLYPSILLIGWAVNRFIKLQFYVKYAVFCVLSYCSLLLIIGWLAEKNLWIMLRDLHSNSQLYLVLVGPFATALLVAPLVDNHFNKKANIRTS